MELHPRRPAVLLLLFLALLDASQGFTSLPRRTRTRLGADPSANDCTAENKLLHALLRVRDVNASLAFWEAQGASVLTFREAGPRKTAFVGFGKHRDVEHFALELTSNEEAETSGSLSRLDFVGVSMLTRKPKPESTGGGEDGFLEFMAAFNKKPETLTDPDGNMVKQVAAAPGDPLCRLALTTTSLERMSEFYGGLLGMVQVARDERELCLRFPAVSSIGMPTTLVFRERTSPHDAKDGSNDRMAFHLAVATADCAASAAALEAAGVSLKMRPTPMFGTTVAEVTDPEGLAVFLIEEAGFKAKASADGDGA